MDRKTNKLKENIGSIFTVGLIGILGYIQDIIFNVDDIANMDEKIIKLPPFIFEDNLSILSNGDMLKSSFNSKTEKSVVNLKDKVIKEEKEEYEEEKYEKNNYVTDDNKNSEIRLLTTLYKITDDDIHILTTEKHNEFDSKEIEKEKNIIDIKNEEPKSNILIELSEMKSDEGSKNEYVEDTDEIFGKYSAIKERENKNLCKRVSDFSEKIEIIEKK